MSEKELFILDASIEKPNGTVEQLSAEEALVFFHPQDHTLLDGTVTITWIEGQPEQILNILLGFALFDTHD